MKVMAHLVTVDFETNIMQIELPEEVVKRGFHAGTVEVDLSGVQSDRKEIK